MTIDELMLIVFIINIPFGHVRSTSTKFSRRWIMAIHIPIPFVFLLRMASGLNWTVIPLVVLSDIAGQIIGGKLRHVTLQKD